MGADSDRVVMRQPSGPAGWKSRRSSSGIEEHMTKTFIGRGELALASGVFLVGQRTMSSKLTPRVAMFAAGPGWPTEAHWHGRGIVEPLC